MSDYAKKTWVNGVDAANQTNLQHIEDGIAAVPGVYFLTTPYLLLNNVSISSGASNSPTATGGSTGVPTGATGILFCCYGIAATAGGLMTIKPHGATVSNNSNYPLTALAYANGATVTAFGTVRVDSGGQIDVYANGSNFSGTYMSIYGYIN